MSASSRAFGHAVQARAASAIHGLSVVDAGNFAKAPAFTFTDGFLASNLTVYRKRWTVKGQFTLHLAAPVFVHNCKTTNTARPCDMQFAVYTALACHDVFVNVPRCKLPPDLVPRERRALTVPLSELP